MNQELEYYRIKRKRGQRDLAFEGKKVAFASSDPDSQNNRWTELCIYETAIGNFIAQSIGKSIIPGEGDISDAEWFSDIKDVQAFFKESWLTKELMDSLAETFPGSDSVEQVD